jgi:hypothetical protein
MRANVWRWLWPRNWGRTVSPTVLRRCVSCGEPFVAPVGTPYGSQCSSCERQEAGRLEAWERSLKMQRALRELEREAERVRNR